MSPRVILVAVALVLDAVALDLVLRKPAAAGATAGRAGVMPVLQTFASSGTVQATTPPTAKRQIPANALVARFRRARQDPAFQQALDAVRRRTTLKAYGPLFDQLQLSPDARERVLALLLEKQIEKSDAEASAPRHTMDAIVAAQAGTDARLEDLLGPAGYQAYVDYECSSGVRGTLDRFAALAAAQGQPLAATVREQAAKLLAASGADADSRAIAGATGLSAEVAAGLVTPPFTSPLPADAPARLASLLTPGQSAALAELMLRQEDELALRSAVLSPPR